MRCAALLQAGLVNMSDIDRAAGNVLRQKFASGLFDDPARQCVARA